MAGRHFWMRAIPIRKTSGTFDRRTSALEVLVDHPSRLSGIDGSDRDDAARGFVLSPSVVVSRSFGAGLPARTVRANVTRWTWFCFNPATEAATEASAG